MIISLFLWLVSMVLTLFIKLSAVFTWFIPTEIIDSIEYLFSYLGYAMPVLPVQNIMRAFSIYLGFMGTLYSWHFLKFVLSFIPSFGDKIQNTPSIKDHFGAEPALPFIKRSSEYDYFNRYKNK